MIPKCCSDCFNMQEKLNTADYVERVCQGCMQSPYSMQQTMQQNPYYMQQAMQQIPYSVQPIQQMPYGMAIPMDNTPQYMQQMQSTTQPQVVTGQESLVNTMDESQRIQTNILYVQGYLRTQIGKKVKIDFLLDRKSVV